MDHIEYCRKYVLFDGSELKKLKEALVGKIEFLERDGTEEKYIVKKDSIEAGMPNVDVVCTVTNEAQTVLESEGAMDQLLVRMAKKIDALMSGLKPCPFCGGRAELDPSFLGSDWGVSCVECGGGFSFSTYGGINHDEAKEAWNKRFAEESA